MTTTDVQGAAGLPANGSPNGTAIRTATVLNAEDVHRDWRHIAAEAVGVTTAVTAAGALALAQFTLLPALMWVLTCACGASAVALIVLLTLMHREGRRWTYATDPDIP